MVSIPLAENFQDFIAPIKVTSRDFDRER